MGSEPDSVPFEAKQMYGLGRRTEAAIRQMYRQPQQSLFHDDSDQQPLLPLQHLELLSRALLHTTKWSD
jgi:hypothetical protein